jgi:hypothetical protein
MVVDRRRRSASVTDVSVDQLLRWNPSLEKDDCIFLEQYSYCVLKRAGMNGEWSLHKILHISEHWYQYLRLMSGPYLGLQPLPRHQPPRALALHR